MRSLFRSQAASAWVTLTEACICFACRQTAVSSQQRKLVVTSVFQGSGTSAMKAGSTLTTKHQHYMARGNPPSLAKPFDSLLEDLCTCSWVLFFTSQSLHGVIMWALCTIDAVLPGGVLCLRRFPVIDQFGLCGQLKLRLQVPMPNCTRAHAFICRLQKIISYVWCIASGQAPCATIRLEKHGLCGRAHGAAGRSCRSD